jgi:hypothetical protein
VTPDVCLGPVQAALLTCSASTHTRVVSAAIMMQAHTESLLSRLFMGMHFPTLLLNSGFTNLSSMPWSDLGCWVYYEDTLPSTFRAEHRPSVPRGGCGP